MKKNIITGTTENGFDFSIDADVLDDYELVELIADFDNGKTQNLPIILNTILGDEQKLALMSHIREKNNGKVKFSEMIKSFFEIMGKIKEGKKS